MRHLEDFMNRLTGMDGGWWPVVFLRPPRNEDITSIVLLKMTSFFGPATGLVSLLVFVVLKGVHAITFGTVCFFLLLGCCGFFVLYKLTFGYFWNCRARRLRHAVTQNEPMV